jgi:hypothetical protein
MVERVSRVFPAENFQLVRLLNRKEANEVAMEIEQLVTRIATENPGCPVS